MSARSLKYRLYPNKNQAEWLTGQLREACDLYNAALEERKSAWKCSQKTVHLYEQTGQLKHLRAQGLISIPNFECAREVLRRLDCAYKALFRRGYGFPRFRSYRRFDSITFRNGFSIQGDALKMQGCTPVSIRLHRMISGKIKIATVKREGRYWFLILVVEHDAEALSIETLECGIDVGLSAFVALSDGTQVTAPQFFRKAQAKLRRAQRHLARCKRGSNRRKNAATRIQRQHFRVRDQRADFHHKLSRKIVNQNQFIAVEDLNVKGLARTRLAKSIHDAGWASFIAMLTYKAADAGRTLVKVNPNGTSQTCICGASVPKKLSDRWHNCPECGLSASRDVVSAQVILAAGRAAQIITKGNIPCVI